MNIPTVKILKPEAPSPGYRAVPEPQRLIRNIAGSFLILVLSVLTVLLLLLPEILDLFRQVFSSARESITILTGLLLAAFLVSLPAAWLVRSLLDYRTARALDRVGIVAKGSLMDKWVEEENGRLSYYIRYKFVIYMNAMQKVERETYERLGREESLYILHLEQRPWISRLDLD
jgi:hypothetical protein